MEPKRLGAKNPSDEFCLLIDRTAWKQVAVTDLPQHDAPRNDAAIESECRHFTVVASIDIRRSHFCEAVFACALALDGTRGHDRDGMCTASIACD